ncbi:MAG: DUF2203 domain-containing protein [Actinomycetota bacterium]|nr:DUF2203 domain-containing protein [Actinomycetota bacterium]
MRNYTIGDANDLLPFLAPALVELREKYEEATRIATAVGTAAASNGWSHEREEWSRKLVRVQELLDRLRDWNVELRDIDTGLVDFPTIMDGGDAYLCWRLGEPEVAFWHSAVEGFSGRHPL